MLTTAASLVSGLIGVAIILIGARFLWSPMIAAAGFGAPGAAASLPWLYAKGVRDIASGICVFLLLALRTPHPLGAFMLAASLIPIGDAIIVLRSGGTPATAYGIHGATAAVMLAAGAALLAA